MWFKKKWVLLALLAAILILVAGIIGGVAYAQAGNSTSSGNSSKTLMGRVAAILGIDQQTLESAFNQAQKEMRSEELDNRLKSLVDEGKLTQEQADQYKQWWQSRPDVPEGLDLGGTTGLPGASRSMSEHRGIERGNDCTPSSPKVTPESN
jgi:hypothetical protein